MYQTRNMGFFMHVPVSMQIIEYERVYTHYLHGEQSAKYNTRTGSERQMRSTEPRSRHRAQIITRQARL